MGRPAGSKNAPKAAPVVASNEATTQTATSNGIKTQYREGGAETTIPSSNSSAFLFGSTPEQATAEAKPEAEFHVEQPEEKPQEEQSSQQTQPEPVQEQPAEEPKNLQPETEEVVYLEDLLKKMNIDPSKVKTKTKVDGVEADVPFSEVKKSYQLQQHLTKRGQKIGEERRRLEEERARLMEQLPQATPAEPTAEVELLRREIEVLKSAIQPTIYQNARQQLSAQLKERGYDDFPAYIDKIEARAAAEPDDNKWKFYNTFEGATQLYLEMKLEEARKQPVKQELPKKEAPRAPVVKIDGGNRPSQHVVDNYSMKMNDLMTKWEKTKNTPEGRKYLNEILRLKGALTLQ